MPRSNTSVQHMLSRDAELAKKKIADEKLSLVIVKQNKTIFTSQESGVKGLIEAITNCGSSLQGAAAADSIVGKAAALLCAYAKVSSVYACVMSQLGEKVLRGFCIPFQYDKLVPKILDQRGTDICPFEKIVLETNSPEEAFFMIGHNLSKVTPRAA
jgi:hypothetical protein